ncbi:hypothetical protein BGZ49_005713 [Haplosporangium sp. Z 27]|nr:hypothetical protein BGZ49_005713 [Haplosporangium sp. Z 27]
MEGKKQLDRKKSSSSSSKSTPGSSSSSSTSASASASVLSLPSYTAIDPNPPKYTSLSKPVRNPTASQKPIITQEEALTKLSRGFLGDIGHHHHGGLI